MEKMVMSEGNRELLLLPVPMSTPRKIFQNAMNLTSSTTICLSDFAHFVFQQTTSYLKMQILQNQEWFSWKFKLLIFNRLEHCLF